MTGRNTLNERIEGVLTLVPHKQKDTDRIRRIVLLEVKVDVTVFTVLK